jgi:NodT family efflux transporter outer membrane factor (OMF) lipoprotein
MREPPSGHRVARAADAEGLVSRSPALARAFASAGWLVLSGCIQLGPDYERPEIDVRDAWPLAPGVGVEAQPDELLSWWRAFDDPTLSQLVEHAYRHNYSLETAGLRVLEARAQLGIAVGSAYPQSQTLSGGATGVTTSEANANTAGGDLNFWQYDVAGNVGWELDFWGRFRRGIESADASFRASVAEYDDALVLLISQVVDTYTLVRTFEERLRIARENLALQRRSYEIAEVKFRNGEDSELDMQQALTLLLSTEATVPALQAQLVQTRNALATLLSLPTAEIDALLGSARGIPGLPASVAIGAPADLLRRRPDVRQAELQAVAQSNLIGVAQADLYPTFVLAGSVGLAAADSTDTTRTGSSGVGELFDAGALQLSGGPQFSWNLFNYGRIKNNVRVQDARLQPLLVNYQDTVLRAAQEVEDAIAAYVNGKQETEILGRTVISARRSSELSVIRYQEGFSDYQRVLDSQQSLFTQQQRYIDAQGQTVRSLIALYKALGGGWQLRAGDEFVDQRTKGQMRERTDWGELLEREATDPETPHGEGTFREPDW